MKNYKDMQSNLFLLMMIKITRPWVIVVYNWLQNYKDISIFYMSNCDLLMNSKITITWVIVIFNKCSEVPTDAVRHQQLQSNWYLLMMIKITRPWVIDVYNWIQKLQGH